MQHAAITPDLIVSIEPATGVDLHRAPIDDVDAAVAIARAAWPQWAMQNQSARMDMVRRWGQDLARMGPDLWHLLARETGMPLWEAQAECDAALARVESLIRAHAERCAQRRHDNGLSGAIAVRHKPHGVMAAITAFAQPLLTAIGQIVPALVAGNTVIHKPSDKSIALGQALAQSAARVGFAPGVFQSIVGGAQSGQALALHDGVDGVLFAGSPPVGVALARKLAARPDRMLRMDLGGSNPLVVWDTPLIEDAATLIVQSAFTGAGQRRTNARRLILREDMAEAVIAAVKRLTDRIIVGGPFDDPTPFLGPVPIWPPLTG